VPRTDHPAPAKNFSMAATASRNLIRRSEVAQKSTIEAITALLADPNTSPKQICRYF